jgi:hypothetical protein
MGLDHINGDPHCIYNHMKYIITESQYKLLMEDKEEILRIPSVELFGDWDALQNFLEKRGNPPYSIGGNLKLEGLEIKSLGNLISVEGNVYLRRLDYLESLGNLTSVGGSLRLHQVRELETLGNLKSVGSDLTLNQCDNIKSTGNLKSVRGDFDLLGCLSLNDIDNLEYVGGDVNLRFTKFSKRHTEESVREMVDIIGSVRI